MLSFLMSLISVNAIYILYIYESGEG